jgi:hypothetical protein
MLTQAAPIQSRQSNQYRAELEKTKRHLRDASQVGLFFGGVNLLIFFAIIRSPEFAESKVSSFWIGYMIFEICLIFCLSYGISQANRGAALAMLGYFLFSKIAQIILSGFSPLMLPLGGLLGYYFCRGVVATAAYHSLQAKILNMDSFDQSYHSHEYTDEENTVAGSIDAAPAIKTVLKFWVADDLVELCAGDRSQAEWLIHQLRVKHPSQDMDWYNERAIEQLNNPKTS